MFFRIYRDPNCVFIRVRKTGSTSVVRGLLQGRACLDVTEAFPARSQGAFCFAFVRHPLDRLLSAQRMFAAHPVACDAEHALRADLTLERVLDLVTDEGVAPSTTDYRGNLKLHALPMSDSRYAIDQADFVGRFERFDEDYRHVAHRLGVPVLDEVPHRRRPEDPTGRLELTDDIRRRVAAIYAEDFQRFGYDL